MFSSRPPAWGQRQDNGKEVSGCRQEVGSLVTSSLMTSPMWQPVPVQIHCTYRACLLREAYRGSNYVVCVFNGLLQIGCLHEKVQNNLSTSPIQPASQAPRSKSSTAKGLHWDSSCCALNNMWHHRGWHWRTASPIAASSTPPHILRLQVWHCCIPTLADGTSPDWSPD